MDDPSSLFSVLLLLNSEPAASPISLSASLWNLLFVALLVLGNAFFVAAEFALVAVRKSRVEAAAADGDRAAQRLLGMLNDLNGYISTTQLGITMFSLGLGWVGEPAVAAIMQPLFIQAAQATGLAIMTSATVIQTVSFVVSFSLITFFLIVFGELAPKTIALELTEKIAYLVAPPLRLFNKIFYYPIRLLEWSGGKTVRLLGFKGVDEDAKSYTEDEIRRLIQLSQESGHLNEEEQRLINQVFEFSETTVKEAMIPRTEMVAVQYTSSLPEIARVFGESGFSRLPVYRESLDDIAGVLHSKDLVGYVNRPKSFKIDEIIIKPNYVVDTARLEDVLRQMQAEKFHFGFVVDEHGGIEGIITLEDLLEEIVGDISDEHDEEVNEQIDEQEDGSVLLDGGLAVKDLNRRLGLHVPLSEGYTTIAGFLMSEAGQILAEGAVVPFNGHIFKVEKVDKHRVVQVRMEATGDLKRDETTQDE